jgi:lauroyl/myristoyl acyltransferase
LAQRLVFRAFRVLGRALPPGALLALLWPVSVVRATLDLRRGRKPPTELPPLNGTLKGWPAIRQRTNSRLTPLAGFWADRFLSPGWAERFDVRDVERLRTLLADRPAVLVSIHFGSLLLLAPVLRLSGIPVAMAVGADEWPLPRSRRWRTELTRIGDLPTTLGTGDARGMLRFLQPGRCLLVTLDYPLGEKADVPYAGVLLRASTPPLRLARAARAVVVPVLAFGDGPWRMRLHVGQPVPDELLAARDYAAAAAHLCAELLPVAATAPGQALPTLVDAFVPLASS